MSSPKRIAIPDKGCIYRGSPWVLRVNFDWDVSALTFAMKIAPELNTATGLITLTTDNTHVGDADPYITCTLSAATSATVSTSVTSHEWDISAGTDSYFYGSVPIRGQVGT